MRKAEDLALYHFESCPYCWKVRRALQRLGVEVELRDIDLDSDDERALVAARGRRTVPVLRIRKDDGTDEWMPESSDIVAYLERRFG